MNKELSEQELKFIQEAYQYLENPSFLTRLTERVEVPLQKGLAALPAPIQNSITAASQKALYAALRAALFTLSPTDHAVAHQGSTFAETDFALSPKKYDRNRLGHLIAGSVAGAMSGLIGVPGLLLELPFTTTLMLRSVAQIAARSGENLNDRETQLDCLFVLSASQNYYATRLAFSTLSKETIAWLSMQGIKNFSEMMLQGTAPIVGKLVSLAASRFQWVVTEKLLAQSIPLFGAVTGGAINLAFIEHFNQVAHFHFGIKSLERRHGRELIRQAYHSSQMSEAAPDSSASKKGQDPGASHESPTP